MVVTMVTALFWWLDVGERKFHQYIKISIHEFLIVCICVDHCNCIGQYKSEKEEASGSLKPPYISYERLHD